MRSHTVSLTNPANRLQRPETEFMARAWSGAGAWIEQGVPCMHAYEEQPDHCAAEVAPDQNADLRIAHVIAACDDGCQSRRGS